MRFVVLGRVGVWAGGQAVHIERAQRRALLGYLLLHHNREVSAAQLVDALWGGRPPSTAKTQVFAAVSAVRRALRAAGHDPVTSRRSGYVFDAGEHQLDLRRFRDLVERSRRHAAQGSLPLAADDARTALDLWQDQPLGGVSAAYVEAARARLEEERLAAFEELFELELLLGHQHRVLPEVQALAEAHPLRERLVGQLMLALYRSGRQPEALLAFRRTRQLLIDELGVEPTHDLGVLHGRILHNDPRLDAAPAAAPAVAVAPHRRRMLPRDVPDFAGRDADLAALDALSAASGRLITIAGIGGIGKTALAVRWAHLSAPAFPDGQLYLNLHGYHPAEPMGPAYALGMLLRSLDVPAERIPHDPEEAAALYRSTVADKQLLILLDNAHSAEQIRPLLPAAGGCLVLVTSRDALTGLVAVDGARRLTLDALPMDDAAALIRRMIGTQRAEAEPEAVRDLTVACGQLPLALRIAAANLASRPGLSVAAFAAELREGDRLGRLSIPEDPEVAVRATLERSYRSLPLPQRRLFRLLGLVPGGDFDEAAATRLTGDPGTPAQLERLCETHLVAESTGGRFQLHDLVRLFAAAKAREEDPGPEPDEALRRLFGYYLRTAGDAVKIIAPQTARLPCPVADDSDGVAADDAGAVAWLKAEQANVVAAIERAAALGMPEFAWLLADALRGWFWISRDLSAWETATRHGLTAALAEDDVAGQAAMHLSLGVRCHSLNRSAEAIDHLKCAAGFARKADWVPGLSSAIGNLGVACAYAGDIHAAIEYTTEAIEIKRREGLPASVAVSVGNLSFLHLRLGLPRPALAHAREGLGLYRESANKSGEALMLAEMGLALTALGDPAAAQEHLLASLALFEEVGDRAGQSHARNALAGVHLAHNDFMEAVRHARAAEELSAEIGDRANLAWALGSLGLAHLGLGELAAAEENLTRSLALATDLPSATASALQAFSRVRSAQGDRAEALRLAHRALSLCEEKGFQGIRAETLATLAQIHLAAGDRREAGEMARQARAAGLETGYAAHLPRLEGIYLGP